MLNRFLAFFPLCASLGIKQELIPDFSEATSPFYVCAASGSTSSTKQAFLGCVLQQSCQHRLTKPSSK